MVTRSGDGERAFGRGSGHCGGQRARAVIASDSGGPHAHGDERTRTRPPSGRWPTRRVARGRSRALGAARGPIAGGIGPPARPENSNVCSEEAYSERMFGDPRNRRPPRAASPHAPRRVHESFHRPAFFVHKNHTALHRFTEIPNSFVLTFLRTALQQHLSASTAHRAATTTGAHESP